MVFQMLILHTVWFMNSLLPSLPLLAPPCSHQPLVFLLPYFQSFSRGFPHISVFLPIWENILIFWAMKVWFCVCCLCVLYFASGLSRENDILIGCAPRLLPTEECFESYTFKWKVVHVEGWGQTLVRTRHGEENTRSRKWVGIESWYGVVHEMSTLKGGIYFYLQYYLHPSPHTYFLIGSDYSPFFFSTSF